MNTTHSLLRRYLPFIGVFFVVVVIAIFFARGSDNREEVYIGVIAPLSGDSADWGQEMRDLLNYRLKEVNKKENSPQYKFKLEFVDGQCDGTKSEEGYNLLKEDKDQNILFVIGGACSAETLAIAPHLVGDNILAMSATSSHSTIDGLSDNLFSVSYKNAELAEGIAKQLAEYSRIVMVTEDNEFNTGLKDDVNSALVSLYGAQGRIAGDIKFPKGESDFSAIIEGLRELNPDVIFLNPNIGETSKNLTMQIAATSELNGVALVGHSASWAPDVIAAASERVEGMIVIDAPHIDSSELDDIEKGVRDSTDSDLGDLGRYYTAATVDALDILVHYINSEGYDVAKVRTALEQKTYNGFIGDIQFAESRFPSVGAGVYKIVNGSHQPYNPSS